MADVVAASKEKADEEEEELKQELKTEVGEEKLFKELKTEVKEDLGKKRTEVECGEIDGVDCGKVTPPPPSRRSYDVSMLLMVAGLMFGLGGACLVISGKQAQAGEAGYEMVQSGDNALLMASDDDDDDDDDEEDNVYTKDEDARFDVLPGEGDGDAEIAV